MSDPDLIKLAEGEKSHWHSLVRISHERLLALPDDERRGSPEMEMYFLLADVVEQIKEVGTERAYVKATLFKPSGKYYTCERWRIPKDAIGPYDMVLSPDFRRIDGGAVLIESQEPWGFPHLFPKEEQLYPKDGINRAAVEAVLEEHPATQIGCIAHYGRTDCECDPRFTCATCAVAHPCPTVVLIREALDVIAIHAARIGDDDDR